MELLERLLGIVLPEGGYVVELVEAYFDESGTHDGSPFLCVAGVVFEKDRAIQLETEWRSMLKDAGIAYFRMSECAPDPGHGEFEGFSKARRIEVSTQAHQLVAKYASYGCAISVDSSAFPLIPNRGRFKTAYSFACWMGLMGVRHWIVDKSFSGDVAYWFESGHKSQFESNRLMHEIFSYEELKEAYRYASHTFADKRKVCSLQCADIFAWHTYNQRNREKSGMPGVRKDFQLLVDAGIGYYKHYGAEELNELRSRIDANPELQPYRDHEVTISA